MQVQRQELGEGDLHGGADEHQKEQNGHWLPDRAERRPVELRPLRLASWWPQKQQQYNGKRDTWQRRPRSSRKADALRNSREKRRPQRQAQRARADEDGHGAAAVLLDAFGGARSSLRVKRRDAGAAQKHHPE